MSMPASAGVAKSVALASSAVPDETGVLEEAAEHRAEHVRAEGVRRVRAAGERDREDDAGKEHRQGDQHRTDKPGQR